MSPQDLVVLEELCSAWNLPPGAAQRIDRVSAPCVLILPETREERDIPVGASKVGGRPDLPLHLQWPGSDRGPAWFLAQLDLAVLPPGGPLPAGGMLWFFYDDDRGASGPGSLVWLDPCPGPLTRRERPADGRWAPDFYERSFPAQVVELRRGRSLPWSCPPEITDLAEQLGDLISFHHDHQVAQSGGRRFHQLFGFPYGWQSLTGAKSWDLILQLNLANTRLYYLRRPDDPRAWPGGYEVRFEGD